MTCGCLSVCCNTKSTEKPKKLFEWEMRKSTNKIKINVKYQRDITVYNLIYNSSNALRIRNGVCNRFGVWMCKIHAVSSHANKYKIFKACSYAKTEPINSNNQLHGFSTLIILIAAMTMNKMRQIQEIEKHTAEERGGMPCTEFNATAYRTIRTAFDLDAMPC